MINSVSVMTAEEVLSHLSYTLKVFNHFNEVIVCDDLRHVGEFEQQLDHTFEVRLSVFVESALRRLF